ncbi:MAG TPA: TonB-dependent receptor [Flavobacteriales bacterium]|nr:TonB-dependent receptor [Flavobacteriales bacterium]
MLLARMTNLNFRGSYILILFLLLSVDGISQNDTSFRVKPDTLLEQGNRLPIFTSTSGDNDDQTESQDISGLLQASRDVYASVAGFNFGNARFRIRGLNSDHTSVFINGIRVNDLETGWASWSNWGGLNDVTRWMEVKTGNASSRIGFTGIGGYSNIDARASSYRKGNRVSYAFSNRSYAHRIMATGSTGMIENGLAITASVSRRYSDEGYVAGTFFDSWSYFLSVEKRINAKHTLSFIGFGAPLRQGRQGLAVQEAMDLAGSNYCNPFWGYQNGEKRNSRVSHNHEPMLMLTDHILISEKTKIQAGVFFSPGKSGQTSLNWYDAKDPRPDYYKYLPSYYDPEYPALVPQVTNSWINDVNTRQINWDQLYFANSKNLYTVTNAEGVAGNNITGNRAKYIVEDQRNDVTMGGLNLLGTHQYNERIRITGGLFHVRQKSHYYKLVDDLLGADFWLDLNRFAVENAIDQSESQADINNPNNVVYKGEVFGYDYNLLINKTNFFAQGEYSGKKVDAYFSAELSQTNFWREGNMLNGMFPNNSEGESEKFNFLNYGVKGGAVYKITGRHYVVANIAHLTRAPLARNVFLSPRTRNQTASDVRSEKVYSGDIGYEIRYPRFKARITGYYNYVADQTWMRTFFHEEYNSFVNYTLTGVDQSMAGLEFGAQYQVTPTLQLNGVVGHGQFLWANRPTATVTSDNQEKLIASEKTVYAKNFHIGGMPETAASLGIKYSGVKNWFAGVNFNYFANIWLEINPDRRTEEAVEGLVITDPQWGELIDQSKLDNNYTIDAFAGKSWRIKSYFLNVNLNVNNILNNRDFRIGGSEQLRYDTRDVNRFPNKYSYHLGTTFYAMVSLRF